MFALSERSEPEALANGERSERERPAQARAIARGEPSEHIILTGLLSDSCNNAATKGCRINPRDQRLHQRIRMAFIKHSIAIASKTDHFIDTKNDASTFDRSFAA